MPKLTESNVKTLRVHSGGDTLYPDTDVRGLYLRVRDTGSRTFVLRWRQPMKRGTRQRREVLGVVGVLSLEDARKNARKMLNGISDGKDPAVIRAQDRVTAGRIFDVILDEYLTERAKDMTPGSHDQIRRHLRVYWSPLHRLPVAKVPRALIADVLVEITKEHGEVAANRARSSLSTFFGWCLKRGFLDKENGDHGQNPVIGTLKNKNDVPRDRVLSDDELVAIWNATEESGDYNAIVRLLMLTGQRRDEIAGLIRTELSLKATSDSLIALPPERTKNKRPHDVPLSATALGILKGIPARADSDFVFGTGEGGFSGFSRAKAALDGRLDANMTPWTLHDLRRTMATRMADIGVQPHVIEAVLNHVSGHKSGVAGIYNRSTYAKEKRAALDLWAGHIQTILAQASGANVLALRPKN